MIPTVSLETAKLLKENGFPQDTESTWVHGDRCCNNHNKRQEFKELQLSRTMIVNCTICVINIYETFSAPTTDELLAKFPSGINKPRIVALEIWTYGHPRKYCVQYRPTDYRTKKDLSYCIPFESFSNELLCESLALTWLYLKKEGLL